jgi:hypothetical protein
MKLDTFSTLVEGTPVYTQKMSKSGQYVFMGVLLLGVSGLVYWKFIRTPKFIIINKDVLKNRVQFKMDNSKRVYYINAGESLNIGKLVITSKLIKQSDSDLVEGIEITQKKGEEIIKNEIIKY